jgi:hypothetical protein
MQAPTGYGLGWIARTWREGKHYITVCALQHRNDALNAMGLATGELRVIVDGLCLHRVELRSPEAMGNDTLLHQVERLSKRPGYSKPHYQLLMEQLVIGLKMPTTPRNGPFWAPFPA